MPMLRVSWRMTRFTTHPESICTAPRSLHVTRNNLKLYSMCVVAGMSFALSNNRHKVPLTITNSLRTAPDTPNPQRVSSPELPSIHIYRTTLSYTEEGEDHGKAQYFYAAYNIYVIL